MPQPNELYVDAPLTGVSASRPLGVYVAAAIFPVIPVAQQTGFIWTLDSARKMRALDNARAAGGEPNIYEAAAPTKLAYNSIDHSLMGIISDEERGQAASAVASEINEAENVTDNIRLKQEIDCKAKIDTLANFSTPGVLWSNASGDAVADIKAKQTTIEGLIGVTPNALVVPSHILRVIGEQTAFRSRFTATMGIEQQQRMGDASKLAALVNIPAENIFVPDGWKNTAPEGATAVLARIWGDDVLLFYREAPKQKTQNLGVHVVWTGGSSVPENMGFLVERERAPRRKADIVIVHLYYDQLLLNPNAGHLFKSVL